MNECVVMMTEENVHGREVVKQLLENGITIDALVLERHGGKLYEVSKNYLRSDYYQPPSLYDLGIDHKIPFYYVANLNNEISKEILTSLKPKIIALGGARILKRYVIDIPEIGILNAHPGLLPEYRGLDPVSWSIFNGDPVGATCHFIVEEPDAGPIILREELHFEKGDSLIKIRIDDMRLCAQLMVRAIKNIETITPQPLDLSRGHKYPAIDKERQKVVREKLNDI